MRNNVINNVIQKPVEIDNAPQIVIGHKSISLVVPDKVQSAIIPKLDKAELLFFALNEIYLPVLFLVDTSSHSTVISQTMSTV
jgi:hypothetical protein